MARLQRPYGKGEVSEEHGRDKNKRRVKARKTAVRTAAKKAVNDAALRYELLNAFRL